MEHCCGTNGGSPSNIAVTKTDFRVREIKRYVVTRYDEGNDGRAGTSREKGVYDNYEMAFEVAYALAQAESDRLGLSPNDARVQYPRKYGASMDGGPDMTGLGAALTSKFQARQITLAERDAVIKFLGLIAEDAKQGDLFP